MTRENEPDARLTQLRQWLRALVPGFALLPASVRAASSDASFRRYFRVDTADGPAPSFIVMDAPPAHEDCRPFVRVAQLLADQGVSAPLIVAQDLREGFLLLSDFGDTTYADALVRAPDLAPRLYDDALRTLIRLQRAQPAPDFPVYDRARLLTELRLFPEWYVQRHLGMELDAKERVRLDAVFERLVDGALAQAQIFVHRDYHCRNLMFLDPATPAPGRAQRAGADPANPGVLDFQDAVIGPISYDLVSLLRDAYVEWPEPQQIDWAARYWTQARSAGLPVPDHFDRYWQDLEWMGLQRSLKILGIFARLCHRDGKTRYLADLPLVLRHTQRVAQRYDAFAGLARLLDRIHQRTPRTGYTMGQSL